MARTRAFKAGDDQAIRIPDELAYADIDADLEISRFGDVITIFPARNPMSDSVAELRRLQEPDRVKKPAGVKRKRSSEVSARGRGKG